MSEYEQNCVSSYLAASGDFSFAITRMRVFWANFALARFRYVDKSEV
jgi:hypothetical protein